MKRPALLVLPFVGLVVAVGCGAAPTAPVVPAALTSSSCGPSAGADACARCAAARCCAEETACLADASCRAAHDAMDTCQTKAVEAGRSRNSCYSDFASTGDLARRRVACVRSECAGDCLMVHPKH